MVSRTSQNGNYSLDELALRERSSFGTGEFVDVLNRDFRTSLYGERKIDEEYHEKAAEVFGSDSSKYVISNHFDSLRQLTDPKMIGCVDDSPGTIFKIPVKNVVKPRMRWSRYRQLRRGIYSGLIGAGITLAAIIGDAVYTQNSAKSENIRDLVPDEAAILIGDKHERNPYFKWFNKTFGNLNVLGHIESSYPLALPAGLICALVGYYIWKREKDPRNDEQRIFDARKEDIAYLGKQTRNRLDK